jgi:K+ transporter
MVLLMLDKVLQIVKHYWKEILVALAVIILLAAWSGDHASLIKSQELAVQTYEAQIKNDKKLHEEELAKKEKALKDYEANIAKLEKDYDILKHKIDIKKKKREKEVIDLAKNDPEKLAEQIHNNFGFEHVQ